MAKKQESNIPFVVGATAALGAIGAYIIYGTKAGKPVKKMIKSGTLKAKAELLERIEAMKEVTEDAYREAVSTVIEKYKTVVDEKEAVALAKELEGYWKALKSKTAPRAKKAAKKMIKNAKKAVMPKKVVAAKKKKK